MDKINQILVHPVWKESYEKIQELEKERIFCGHDLEHFLDVARIAYIETLERNLNISREKIYSAALLHDIGRHLEYIQGIPHNEASCVLAEGILKDCGFEAEDRKEILDAIRAHRSKETGQQDSLSGVLYRADKKSRKCLVCRAQEQCNWSQKKKNLTITI